MLFVAAAAGVGDAGWGVPAIGPAGVLAAAEAPAPAARAVVAAGCVVAVGAVLPCVVAATELPLAAPV
jgi:hypothetical protein